MADDNKVNTDDIDSFLLGEDVIGAKVDKKIETNPIQQAPSNQSLKLLDNTKDEILNLVGNIEDYPLDYIKMVDRIRIQYALLPTLNYDAIYKELAELSIKSSPTPTLQVLNDELYKVQSAKDRLSEIVMDVIKCYNFKNRAVDILRESWGRFTTEKNTEGRKGDSAYRLSNFSIDFALVESLSKACNHILKNLDSLHDNLSRRITVFQLIMKLRDIGRNGMPDYDFDKKFEGNSDFFGEKDDSADEKPNKEGGAIGLRQF